MAGDARAQTCLSNGAEPCVALAAAGDLAHAFNNLLSIITTYTMLVLEDLEADDPSRADLEEVCRAAERAHELTRELRMLGRRCSGVVPSI